jgi:hypothetical protein
LVPSTIASIWHRRNLHVAFLLFQAEQKESESVEKSFRETRTEDDDEANLESLTPDSEKFELGEDVYSLIFISPVCSVSFLFAASMIALKLTLFTLLAVDLLERSSEGGRFASEDPLIRATQFFLLPVAVAMQEDLIYVYTRIGNIRYDKTIMEKSPAAKEWKFALSFFLRFLDGSYSLIVNFVLLLITDDVLSLFLNFAALAFLQSLDDVAFSLAADGVLGDRMEDNCTIVKASSLPKRVGHWFSNSLDTILFLTTYGVMLTIYIYVFFLENSDDSEK